MNSEIYSPYGGAGGMLLHINGKFTIRTNKGTSRGKG
jgi:hypothetical protein